ncbi:hypothetical protein M9H77_17298 [Catharanthus roseus]|uniref:Uncharacterized protein n=1 Tax=Catharanthus roseus TaxID=4058 RepID=A0ACC0B452_CATRO|nr:hypothetical protein M9H77_17298 [Catharanthus roseus]
MVEELGSNCLHYLRKSHGLPCACELVHKCQYLIPIREEDVEIFWRKLEIGYDILEEHDRDMDSEIRDLTSLIHEISMGPISKVWEVRRLIKGRLESLEVQVLDREAIQVQVLVLVHVEEIGRLLLVSESHWEYSRDSVSSGDCGGGTNPCNHPCRNLVEWPEHWSMSLSISTKVPRAIVPPQKYFSTRTSCCLAACVPLEAG